MSVAENARQVLENVAEAARNAGRDPSEVTLVAASKMNSAEAVIEAKKAGICVFGENKVQELLEKQSLGAYEGAKVHLIGHLQKNKVRQIVGKCDLIQSVDSAELLMLISRKAESLGICQDVLIEINIGGEESKTGAKPEMLEEILVSAGSCPGIRVLGLMAIPPSIEKNTEKINFFEKMNRLFVDIGKKKYDNVTMCILSMGMSADFEQAIAAGATMVRVGTSIFGYRDYMK